MATVTLRRPRHHKHRRHRRHRAVIRARGGPKVRLPIAPREAELDGDAPTITIIDRPGRKPLTRVTGDGLPVLTFTAILAHDGTMKHVEPVLRKLRRIAHKAAPLVYQHGSQLEAGVWRISRLTPAIISRNRQNRATHLEVAVELTRATDTDWHGGPTKGGHRDGHRGGDGRDKPRVHVWRKADTPARVARRYYGDPNMWHVIAHANHIRHPRRIKVGRKLRIPPRPRNPRNNRRNDG